MGFCFGSCGTDEGTKNFNYVSSYPGGGGIIKGTTPNRNLFRSFLPPLLGSEIHLVLGKLA